LLLTTLVWGTTFPAMKGLSTQFAPVWIIVVRFGLAGFLLLPWLWRARSADLLPGVWLGLTLFACYILQLHGLELTTSNRNAFITGLSVLVVPLLGLAMGNVPERKTVLAILLAVLGLVALCWDGDAWGEGDMLSLAGALCFGFYIKLLESMSRRADNVVALTAIQIVVVALCAVTWLLMRGDLSRVPGWGNISKVTGADLLIFLYLSVIATAAMMPLQTWGQKRSSANDAAVIYAFEPACAAIAAYWWLGETMTWRGMVGAGLLVGGIVVSQWSGRSKEILMTEV